MSRSGATSPAAARTGTARPKGAAPSHQAGPDASATPPDDATDAAIDFDLIELFFFAYRDFVGDPDRILSDYGFGRAHHRVLHFVNRRPGLTIAELLDILGITKQSLNRVLKELIETGFVESRTGETDRRQRLLFPTPDGRQLAVSLARLQHERLARALAMAGPHARAHAALFLDGMSARGASAAPQGDTT